MIILGINISHNSSACLMIAGEVKLAIQEERLVRKKNFTGYPKKSIDFCIEYLKKNKIKADCAVLTTKFLPGFSYKIPLNHYFTIKDYQDFYGEKFYGKIFQNKSVDNYIKNLVKNRSKKYDNHINYDEISHKNIFKNCNHLFIKYLKKQTKNYVNDYKVLDHHSCHANYALYGFETKKNNRIGVVTMDSWGDGRNQTFWIKEADGEFKEISSSSECQVGRIYKFVTLILAMKPDEHEYKVMGMAPYAKKKYAYEIYEKIFKNLLQVKDCKVIHKNKPKDLYSYLKDTLRNHRFDNIASAVQIFVEKILTELFTQIYKKYKITNFCFSGGVAMNVKANKTLTDLSFVKSLNVPPSGGDESLCIGGCYMIENNKKKPLSNIYIGKSISNTSYQELIKIFPKNKYKILKNIKHKQVANLINDGKIIGVARGSEEFGARALGNRSILANPSKVDAVRKINDQIKNRDFWMPFALTILKDKHKKFLKNKKNINSEYMTVAMDTVSKNYKKIISGSHQYDKTVRPQILEKKKNEQYYDLIREFEKISKIPAILNTSLNLHGLPIASNMINVAEVIKKSDLKYLYINDNFLIEKK
jgi:carbamoyltransferase